MAMPQAVLRREYRRDLAWLLSLAVATGLYLLLASPATADQTICGPGSGAGECAGPAGVAVDREEGLLYVADNGNHRVDVFEVDGTFLRAFGWDVAPDGAPGDTVGDQLEVCTSSCMAGSTGSGSGQFSALRSIAVDNDELSPAFGDVYVYDGGAFGVGNHRVQRFDPSGEFILMFGGKVNKTKVEEGAPAAQQNVCTAASGNACQVGTASAAPGHFASGTEVPRIALGTAGVIHSAEVIGEGRRVQKFSHEGELLEGLGPLPPGGFANGLNGFTVEGSGSLYLANGAGTGAVRKYDSSGALLATFHSSFNIQDLALDAADDLYVIDSQEGLSGGKRAIYRYEAGTTLNGVAYGDAQRRYAAAAPYSGAGGDVFAIEENGAVWHIPFPPPGPVIPSATGKANPIGNTKATLNAAINPEGKASTYYFEYVDEATYQAEGFANPKSTAESPLVPPAKPAPAVDPIYALAAASAQIGCPEPTQQVFEEGKCLTPETSYHFRAVAKNADGEDVGDEATFETEPPLQILATWATEAGPDSVVIQAQANPLGIPLSGRFEYVDEATFLKSGFAEASETEELDFGAGNDPVTRSAQLHQLTPDTAYRYRVVVENLFGFSQAGPERVVRTFPLLEAVEDNCANAGFRAGPAAALPDCRAYEMVSPVDKEGGEIEALAGPVSNLPAELNQSAAVVPAEGRGITYSSYRAFGDAISVPFTSQYIASRYPLGDPQEGWQSHGISPQREGSSLFADDLGLDTQYKAFSEDLRYGWLRNDSEPALDAKALPGYANLYRRDNADESFESACSVKPPSAGPSQYIPEPQGVSADAEITIFRANDKLSKDASGAKMKSGAPIRQLYGCTGEALRVISVLPPTLGGKASGGNSAVGTRYATGGDHRELSLHNAVSEDASRVYWSDTGEAETGSGKIYLRQRPFAAGAECAGETSPCTVAVSEAVGGPGASAAAHFWTAAPDGSRAIFSFVGGALQGNLYEFDAETATPSLIAKGVSGLAGFSEDAARLYLVSGEALAPGAVAGEANLYLHEAEGGDFTLVATLPGGASVGACAIVDPIPIERCARSTPDGRQLAFLSDDPLTGYDNADAESGKAAVEVYLFDSEAGGGEGELLCVSCNPSGGRPAGRSLRSPSGSTYWVAARIPGWEHGFHASRVISTDGRRLFFESFDALLPTDTNGALDVYQWERAGKGSCEIADANHFEASGGCLDLISSGKGAQASEFVDASASGEDVFFKTSDSLALQDPGLIDIYDARVEGGFPPPEPPPGPCEGDSCQSPAAPPRPATPASAVLRGVGNVSAPRKSCPRSARRAERPGRRASRAARRAQDPSAAGRLRRRAKGQVKGAKRCRAPKANANKGGGR
ncbi:MAG: hypothetical protein ABW196_12640 [Solirubrobacterales bacterium]